MSVSSVGANSNILESNNSLVLDLEQASKMRDNKRLLELVEKSSKEELDQSYSLYHCASWASLEVIEAIVDKGADLNIQKDKNDTRTPLLSIMKKIVFDRFPDESLESKALFLIEKGADVTLKKDDESTLSYAIARRKEKIALAIIEIDPDRDYQDSYYHRTHLMEALFGGHKNIAWALIKKGPNIKLRDVVGRSLLHYAALMGDEEIILNLKKLGCAINPTDKDGCTPLLFLALDSCDSQKKTLISAQALLRAGANINALDPLNCSSLDYAICRRNLELARFLISQKADLKRNNDSCSTLIHLAARENHPEIIPDLVKAGVDINAINKSGETALHLAILFKNNTAIAGLIKAGANVNALNKNNIAPLEQALNQKNIEAAKILLINNVKFRIKDGLTSLHFAVQKRLTEIIPDLIKAGTNINAQDAQGRTPLMLAAANQDEKAIIALLNAKADKNIKNEKGKTAFNIYMNNFGPYQNPSKKIVDLLKGD